MRNILIDTDVLINFLRGKEKARHFLESAVQESVLLCSVITHLLKSPELDTPASRFEGQGENRIAKTKGQGLGYEDKKSRININKTQYFAPVTPEIWEYRIGGYQVCEKWLKDRKDRRLELKDIRTYCCILTALERTLQIQKEINVLYPKIEEKLLRK